MNRLYPYGEAPLVMAHRGGGNEQPENSFVAFEAMRAQGFTYMETDAHVTSDGVAVISHDPMLDRITDGSGLISRHTWREISTLRDESGNRLVRVDELLDSFPELVFNIDAKVDDVVDPLINAINHTRSGDRVCVASFSEKRLRRVRKRLPGVATALGVSAIARMVGCARLPGAVGSGLMRSVPGPRKNAEVAQVPEVSHHVTVVTERFVNLAHHHGIAVHVWTINDIDTVNVLLDMGVDGIITDEPTAVRDVIRSRGVSL